MKTNEIIFQDKQVTKFLIKSRKYGKFIVEVDTEDYEEVKKYRWHLDFRHETKKPKAVLHNGIALHNFLMNPGKGKIIDHINNDPLINRKKNLRECFQFQNAMNKKKAVNNTSGYKGVYWKSKNKVWGSNIRVNKKLVHLGYYKDKLEAAIAYNKAALKYHGEFANINNI